MPEEASISLSTLVTSGGEPSFLGPPVPAGVHLRWAYPKRLGPPQYFEIFRIAPGEGYGYTHQILPDPERLVTLAFPRSPDEAWARVRSDLAGGSLEPRYRNAGPELFRLLRDADAAGLPMHQVEVPHLSDSSGMSTRLYLLDMLALATLDPYLARMLGVYWVDRDLSLVNWREYFVRGHWGTRPWPVHVLDFTRLHESSVHGGVFVRDGVELGLRRLFASSGDLEVRRSLIAIGDAPLEIRLPAPAEALTLEIRAGASGAWSAFVDGATALPAVSGERLEIRRSDGRPFGHVLLFGPPGQWNIYHLVMHERAGSIGTLESPRVRIEQSAATTPAPPVSAPRLGRLEPLAIPSALDSRTGEVPESGSQVALAAVAETSPEDQYRPVRFLVGRSPAAHAGEPVELVTADTDGVPSPAVFQALELPGPLPELLALLPLDGHARDLRTGSAASIAGGAAFVKGHPEQAGRPALELAGDAFLTLPERPPLQSPGASFTLDARVFPAGGQDEPVLIGNGAAESYALSLRRLAGGGYLPRLALRGAAATVVEAQTPIPARRWSRITVTYDGEAVRFFVGARPDVSRAAAVGPIRLNPRGAVVVGAESGSAPGRPVTPFRGRMADVSIWQRALHPLEIDDRLTEDRHGLAAHLETADLIAAWPAILEIGEDRPFVVVGHRPELQSLGTGMTLELWLRPERGLSFPTLIGNDWQTSFWLGLLASGDGYLPRLWLNRPSGSNANLFHATTPIRAEAWSHVVVSYDGAHVRFYVNGREDGVRPAALGPIRPNPRGTLVLGADSGSSRERPLYPYRGRLAGVRIWQRALNAVEAERRLASPQYVDRPVPDGRYAYRIRGVDLFGRVSGWSEPETVDVADLLPPTPPTFVRASFVQPAGRIEAVTDGLGVTASLPAAAAAIRDGTLDPGALVRSDLLVMREVERAAGDGSQVVRQAFEVAESPPVEDDHLTFRLQGPAFAQLRPEPGDRVVLAVDHALEVAWAWTGLARLFNPRTREFRVYLERDPAGTLRGKVTSVAAVAGTTDTFRVSTDLRYEGPAGGLEGRRCQVGGSLYTVASHGVGPAPWLELAYRARPVVVPSAGDVVLLNLPDTLRPDRQRPYAWSGPRFVEPLRAEEPIRSDVRAEAEPIDAADRDRLERQGVRWLPEGQTFRLALSGTTEVDRAGVPRSPDDFVPGALVAFEASAGVGPWHAYNVLWEEPSGADLILYVQHHDAERPGGAAAEGFAAERMRYYRGQRYRRVLPVASTFGPGEPTVSWACGVTSADGRAETRDHRGEAGRHGNESAIGQVATAVAVDRRRPQPAPRPVIESFGRADYYGRSEVRVAWAAASAGADDVGYLLYRAVDTAVFTRDLEQRRLRTGAYEAMSLEDVFADDVDFGVWLPVAARRLGLDGLESDWRGRLFPPRPRGPRPADSPPAEPSAREAWEAWDAVTPFWRAWADRFYPALTDAEVAELAGRPGNESAFALVQGKPIGRDGFADHVPGRVTNRYLYRLRTQSAALQGSSGWSAPSAPAASPKTAPPRAPAFTRVEAGDREVALDWALNTEPDLVKYRLYRAESAEELEDLRWWGDEPDPRVVATVVDPRLQVLTDAEDNAVLPLVSPPAGTCVGVYSVDEFDASAVPLFPQPAAFNYLADVDDAADVARLRRIAPGTAVVVLVQQDEGRFQIVDRRSPDPPHVDAGVPGLRDLYYRLVAVNSAGLQSEASEIRKARATDAQPPEPPTWVTSDRIVGTAGLSGVELAWEVTDRDVRCIVQRRAANRAGWTRVSDWLRDPEPVAGRPGSWRFRFTDQNADADAGYEYRVRVESAAGILNAEFESIYITPEGG